MSFQVPWWIYFVAGAFCGTVVMLPFTLLAVWWVGRETPEEKAARENLDGQNPPS